MTRNATLFSIRYAARVLERYARMWGIVGNVVKFTMAVSGSAALAALVGTKTTAAITLGIVFAVMQALEATLQPAKRRAEALAMRRSYARLQAGEGKQEDAALEAAYWKVAADDDITVPAPLKELAYNDVVRERGLDETACYPDHPLLRACS